MLALRCYGLSVACALVSGVFLVAGFATEARFARPIDGASLSRVRALNDDSDSIDSEQACAYWTFGDDAVVVCDGEADGTECYDCDGNSNGRMAMVEGENDEAPIQRAGGLWNCTNLVQFFGECEDGICVGDDDEDDCGGSILVYEYEP
jgi:hypothetical protein